jgi:hypothetical protein
MTFIPQVSNQMPQDGTLVANAGRFGDTFVRNVHGAPSHVNNIEAKVIDNLGLLGQTMVKNTRPPGTETVNPVTGMNEYFPWGALLSAGFSAYNMMKPGGLSDGALADKMSGYKDRLDTLDARADGMMDPNSPYNQNMMNDMNKRSMDQLAFSEMMGGRGAAQGGVGGYSGIQGAQAQANLDKAQAMSADMANKTQLKGQLLGGYKEYDQMFAQKAANEAAQKQLMTGQLISGLGQGLTYQSMKNDQQILPQDLSSFGDTFDWMTDEQKNIRSTALETMPWLQSEEDPDYDWWDDPEWWD